MPCPGGCLLLLLLVHAQVRTCPFPSVAPCPVLAPDFNLSKVLEGARPESSATSAGVTNPIWLVGS